MSRFQYFIEQELRLLKSLSQDNEGIEQIDREFLIGMHNFTSDMLEEYSGNFILTTDEKKYEEHCDRLCCGIVKKTFMVRGRPIYYAMDYGH